MPYSDYQLQLLNRMGVDVWVTRKPPIQDNERDQIVATHTAETGIEVGGQPTTDTGTNLSGESASNSLYEGMQDNSLVEDSRNTTAERTAVVDILPSLDQLRVHVTNCQRCELHATRTNVVFGDGDPNADWMFVGEAPGQQEDLQGSPFVGRAGKLLDLMILALGIQREDVYVANVLKCRPPNNRDPLSSEVEQCENYLKQQLALVQPKVIVALGRISAQALLKTTKPLGKIRGSKYYYGEQQIPLIATYHPAYLLRSPDQKSKAWDDLWFARELVESASSMTDTVNI
ncbi:MAG: uracil-DNA glycosylase [Gammaproteobacteria bacterium]|nr:uracil-DNA glycosylase [Gammaproteobacteria bacterium]